MSIRIGIAGVSGYGGGELLRLCAGHPKFEVVYAAGESSAGQKLVERFPGISPKLRDLAIQKWDPAALPKLDLLFASLPTGQSKAALVAVPKEIKVVDIGGDHRFADGWVYGLADVWPEKIRDTSRVANPGCYPAASLGAMAPIVSAGIVRELPVIIDAKSGVSGAGRGGGESNLGYAEVNEDVSAYGLLKHPHVWEMHKTLEALGLPKASPVFTPHLIPMTRGILATCYLKAKEQVTTEDCIEAAKKFYADRPFVRVVEKPPHTKWATGSNLLFVSYASDPEKRLVIALGAIDNLGKGAAGQAVQNANLMFGFEETMGLEGVSLWP
jgi:N-acetyl-gamma-glutamyl-phosphate reductase